METNKHHESAIKIQQIVRMHQAKQELDFLRYVELDFSDFDDGDHWPTAEELVEMHRFDRIQEPIAR